MNSPVRHPLLLALASLALPWTGCVRTPTHYYEFTYEIRAPATTADSTLSFDLVNAHAMYGSFARSVTTHRREEQGFVVYSHFGLASQRDRRWALVVYDGSLYHLFVLPLALGHRALTWTPWRSPDYVTPTDPRLIFLRDPGKLGPADPAAQSDIQTRYRFANETDHPASPTGARIVARTGQSE